MIVETLTLTPEERDDVEDLPGRQPGCPDKTCGVCRANQRRADALAKALRILDAQAQELAYQRIRANADMAAQIERDREVELIEQRQQALVAACTAAERSVLDAMASRTVQWLRDTIDHFGPDNAPAEVAELARRAEKL